MAQINATDGVQSVLPQIQAPDDRQNIQASPADFGSLEAEGKQQVGQGLQKVGADVNAIGKVWGEIQTDGALNNAMTTVNQHLDSYRALNGREALDAQEPTEKAIDDAIKQGRNGLKLPQQQYQYDQSMRTYRQRYVAGIISSHADSQGKAYQKQTNAAAFNVALTNVANVATDDEHVQSFLHDARAAAVKQVVADGNSHDGNAVQDAINKSDRAVYKTQAETLEVTDPVRALSVVNAHKDILGLEYAQLSDRLRTRVAQQKAVTEAPKYLNRMISPGPNSDGGGSPSPFSLGNVKTTTAAAHGTQEYEQPASPIDGVVLAANNLRKSYDGLTVAQIGAKWAPPSENNTADWVKNVTTASGLKPDQVPNLNDPTQLKALLVGISTAEKSPADRANFSDAILTQGVQDSVSGKSPKLVKSAILMDEAQTLAQIDRDHGDDPHLAGVIKTAVKQQYAEAKTIQQAQQLQQQDQVNQAMRKIGDIIYQDPRQNIDPLIAATPGFSFEQTKQLREYRDKTIAERLNGTPDNPGPGFDKIQQRILRPAGLDGIRNLEQLGPELQSGNLNARGYAEASALLEKVNKPGAESERGLLADFYREAKQKVTLQYEDEPGIKVEGSGQKWVNARAALDAALTKGKAEGLTVAQMVSSTSKQSIWPALGEPGGLYLPSANDKTKAAMADDVGNAVKGAFKPMENWTTLTKYDDAAQALKDHKITIDQAVELVRRHPEWNIALPKGTAPETAPRVPTD